MTLTLTNTVGYEISKAGAVPTLIEIYLSYHVIKLLDGIFTTK